MKRALHYIPTLVLAVLIAYLSLIRDPGFRLPQFNVSFLDKWAHLLMYFVFGAAFTYDLWRDGCRSWQYALMAVLLPTIYGGIIEILQENFFYPRTGEWLDWAADAIGALTGFAVVYGVKRVNG